MSNSRTSHRHHAIDYIEITVSDVELSKQFYSAALGWSFVDYSPVYCGIQGEGREMGGLTKGKAMPGGSLVVVFSECLDATLVAVQEAGGRIVKEPFEFPGGRRFHFADPSDNELAVWTVL